MDWMTGSLLGGLVGLGAVSLPWQDGPNKLPRTLKPAVGSQ